MKKTILSILESLLGMRAGMIYVLVFAAAIGVATFVENDFGTSAAQKWIYQASWFEVLLILFMGAVAWNIHRYRLIQRRQWASLTFHLSFIIILIGAGITRWTGYEGTILIFEGESENRFFSRETYVNLDFQLDGRQFEVHEPVLFSSLGENHFKKVYDIAGDQIEVELVDFIPNPIEVFEDTDEGTDFLKVIVGSSDGRQEFHVARGEVTRFAGTSFSFEGGEADVVVQGQINDLKVVTGTMMTTRVMSTGQVDTLLPGEPAPIQLLALYQDVQDRMRPFVFGGIEVGKSRRLSSEGFKISGESSVALKFNVTWNDEKQERWVVAEPRLSPNRELFNFSGGEMSLSYGSMIKTLPFTLHLYDFQMERYPGTNSPMSFASEVRVVDREMNHEEDFRIYMNHILNYRGYRFFQSSYTPDETGTYLSVNHDAKGTWVTYLGYFLLTLGMLWSLIDRKSRFRLLLQQIKAKSVSKTAAFAAIGLLSFGSIAQTEVLPEVSAVHAEKASRLQVQDFRGRMKPFHTLSREILRKVYGKGEYQGMNADQTVLSMFATPRDWYGRPIVNIDANERLQEVLGIQTEYAAFKDFFNEDGSYKLTDLVSEANRKDPIDKSKLDKLLIQVDERVNILNNWFSGTMLRVVPLPNDPNHTWTGAPTHGREYEPSVPIGFFSAYRESLLHGIGEGHYTDADALVENLIAFQIEWGEEIIQSEWQQKAEITLNKMKVFTYLVPVYGLLAFIYLGLLFTRVLKPSASQHKWMKVLNLLTLVALGFHVLGLALRWYAGEHAPWSNGYETMAFISSIVVLASLLFLRKGPGGMAASSLLTSVLLLIAMISSLNPEITPLVPVLKSYWMQIHVSIITGSYAFLMLGAIIGVINLILLSILTSANRKSVMENVRQLTAMSEIVLIVGVFLLSIGTYLGGVWANESWGRYWGWDAKETWALVSILVYAFILHMRFIPGLRGVYAFNVATLFGLASIVMTYYGVNYFLSGLHSYAAGEPEQIPKEVFVSISALTLLSFWAMFRYKRIESAKGKS